MAFLINDRVRVSSDYHWARGAAATICRHPGGNGVTRTVDSLRGPLEFYWVRFDEGQMDSDGDGPYQEAEIEASALLPA